MKSLQILLTLLHLPLLAQAQEGWTLHECLEYALQNNIQIQKSIVSEQKGEVSLNQYKAQLLPTLSFATTQSLGYRPFQESSAIVQDGQVTAITKKVTGQGTYGLNASWTVWNGGANRMNVKNQEIENQISSLSTEITGLSIQEEIAKLYVAILYTSEAEKVAEQLAETAKKQWERGQALYENGQMAKAEVTTLEAQYSNARYDVVNSRTQIANYKRQLKALLELDLNTAFDITGQEPTDDQVMQPLPSAQSVFEQAMSTRPEIRSALLSIDAATLKEKIEKAGYQPTVTLNGGIGDSHSTGSSVAYGQQMKRNLNGSLGVTISVPIFDQQRVRSAVEKARLSKTDSQLDLMDQRNKLSSVIEDYWLNATTNQQRYLAARSAAQSQRESYNQLNEQFKEGLKNVVELLQGRDNLLNAEQKLLESKYNALLYAQLLKFYAGAEIDM
ncbi:MAG: TolC family protein [Bacteroidales bacterium]|nr:TolC family protein [Candidatus Physcousia equi]